MSKITITEALAELNLIDKRIVKKQEFIQNYLVRQEALKDPLLDQGGSILSIAEERQAINDLQERKISIRRAINDVNSEIEIKVGKDNRTIAEWLIWRREVAPSLQNFLRNINNTIQNARQQVLQKGFQVVQGEAQSDRDFHINLDEKKLSEEIENLEIILETLDGKLSLRNATTTIEL